MRPQLRSMQHAYTIDASEVTVCCVLCALLVSPRCAQAVPFAYRECEEQLHQYAE